MGKRSEKDAEKLREAVLAYLGAHNTMTIAAARDNIPWAAALFYVNDRFTLYYLSDPDTRHSMHIAVNPAVGVAIHEDYYDYRKVKGIQMEGRVEPVTAEDEMAEAARLYVQKYPYVYPYLRLMMSPFPKVLGILERAVRILPGIPDFSTPFPARFYRVVPQRVFWIDNERSFGKPQELFL